jgi:hypothetical protein
MAAAEKGRAAPVRARLLLCSALLLSLAPRAAAQSAPPASPPPQRPGREVSFSPVEVKDTFFAYVLGIIRAGVEVDIDNAAMREILTEFKSSLSLPFDLISRVSQHTEENGGARRIGIDFSRIVTIPIPFSLLFYHPGSIVASQSVFFAETVAPGPAYELALAEGSILVDVDDWLEVLFATYIEDTWIRHLVFFQWHGDWIGLLEGSGRRTSRQIRAYFDFTKNTIIFPTPAALDAVGKVYVP